jgi:hypothetical protein
LWGALSDERSDLSIINQSLQYLVLCQYVRIAQNNTPAIATVGFIVVIIIIIISYYLTTCFGPHGQSSGEYNITIRPLKSSENYRYHNGSVLPEKKVVGLERGPFSLVSTTEELLDRKVAAPVYKTENTAVGIRHSDHVASYIRKIW